ncbi:MAG: UDP-N-acetylmuramate dehydrogenase [Actinobacteria bacterium]|nr:UDP-N-acetylmuramate dehydrogenase [Actinomycetota bacterium]
MTQPMPDDLVERDVPLGAFTTYKAGGPARFFARVGSRRRVLTLIESGITTGLPILVLGRGSNLVVSDRGFPGLVVHLDGEFARYQIEGVRVSAGAAVPLPRLARATSEAGVTGLEFFVGIPGSVGGAVRQNAGCFGRETRDVLAGAEVVDLRTGVLTARGPDELELAYRHSALRPDEMVLQAVLTGAGGDVVASGELIREVTRWRRDNQPGGTLNAGSVFKNPEGDTAGELIDRLGLKGLRVGDVSVSEKHANFFVAGPGARADDIHRLAMLVKDRVFALTGTILEPEIQFVGFEE